MGKINVLQVVSALGLGGIQKALQHYTEHLSKEIFDTTVCGLFKGGPREKFLRDKGFDVVVLNGEFNGLSQLMQSKNIDILHIHQHADLNVLALRAGREANVPVIVETNEFGRIRKGGANDLPDLNLLVGKMCALRYKLWKNLSWAEFFKESDVLYNPIVLSDFLKPDELMKKELRKKYHIPADSLIIGRHGRPDPSKWGDICLDMMPYLLKIFPNVKYLALGLPESKIRKIKDMGLDSYFIFFEPTEDFKKINEFLLLLDVFTYSSVNGECLSVAIAEAMTCKLPVVVNSTPCRDNGQVEMIDHGKNGFIANNPRAFAEAVSFLLKNEKERTAMGEAARRKVEDNYEIRRNTLRLERFYLDLLAFKGVEIDSGIRGRYVNIETYPSMEEVINFEREYKERIRICWGKRNYGAIYFWEKFVSNYRFYTGLKSIKDKISGLKLK